MKIVALDANGSQSNSGVYAFRTNYSIKSNILQTFH